jgi:hypothetical protein
VRYGTDCVRDGVERVAPTGQIVSYARRMASYGG